MIGREIDEMLHKIREEHAKEIEGLSPEEKLKREEEQFDKDVRELGLKTMKLADRAVARP